MSLQIPTTNIFDVLYKYLKKTVRILDALNRAPKYSSVNLIWIRSNLFSNDIFLEIHVYLKDLAYVYVVMVIFLGYFDNESIKFILATNNCKLKQSW